MKGDPGPLSGARPGPVVLHVTELRDELKAGNLWVRYPKRFARLEDFFIDDRHWQGMPEDFFLPVWFALRYRASTQISRA
jgi:hypothetical protein